MTCSFKRLYFKNGTMKFFLLWNFDKQDEVQLLAKFKQILYVEFRAALHFRKFKVAVIPMYRIF